MSQFLSAQDENTLRHKVGMILFTLEKAIGDSLKQDHPELSDQVADSYFQELLDDAAAQGMYIARVCSKRSDRGFFIAEAEAFDWTVLCHVDDALEGNVEFRRVCEKDLVVLQLQDDSGDNRRARSWKRVTEAEVSRNAN